MRVAASATSVSWIPSESISGVLRRGFDVGVTHYDEPPPDVLRDVDHVRELRDRDRLRFANVLSAWAEVEDGRIVGHGLDDASGLYMGSTTVWVAAFGATFRASSLPVLRRPVEAGADRVRFTQTVGGRTGAPLPRPVPHAPFVRWSAPIVWTTLTLEIAADGSAQGELVGASPFPRHWVYGPDGRLASKSGLTDQTTWLSHSFGTRTPWGDQDAPAVVTAAETELERQMSRDIMRGGRAPEIRRLAPGATLTRQGEPGDELFLLLDGVLAVEVDGTRLAELGPGAVVGERALLEGGRRTATLIAVTPARVAAAASDAVDIDGLRALASGHRREEAATDAPPR